jgi:hypothetical protein
MFGPLERVEEELRELAGEDRAGWSGAAHSANLLGLLASMESMRVELVRAVGDWDASGAWAEDGAASPVGWLRSRGAMTDTAASQLLNSARLARDHAPTGDALRAGRLPVANLYRIGQVVGERMAAFCADPELLLHPAAEMTPAQFTTVANRWRDAADDALSRSDAAAQHDAQHMYASKTLGSMVAIGGLLAPEAGELLLQALDAYETPDPKDGPRRRASQRRADAFVDMVCAAIEHHNQGGQVPVGLDTVIDLQTFAPDAHAQLAAMRCDLDRIGPISHATLERLACDCAVGYVIMRGGSEVLDVGRRTRVVSRAQRRALVHRDGGCAFPGCDRPHRWCDAHHLIPWQRGGPTDLDNLCLLCRRHHVMCHERGWQLARGPDGTLIATPPGPPEPRGPDNLTLAA